MINSTNRRLSFEAHPFLHNLPFSLQHKNGLVHSYKRGDIVRSSICSTIIKAKLHCHAILSHVTKAFVGKGSEIASVLVLVLGFIISTYL